MPALDSVSESETILVWGWIPNLYPSFDMKFTELLFGMSVKKMDGISIHSNDRNPNETVSIKYIDNGRGFSYDIESFGLTITVGSKELKTDVTVYRTGMVCFDVKDQLGLDEDAVRYAVREIYFAMKNLYHRDIHHETDQTGSMTMKYGDDNFSVIVADDMLSAVNEIFVRIIEKCENNLIRYRMMGSDDSLSHSTMYLLTAGFITYGYNFISVHRDIIGDKYEKYVQSLDCCDRTLRSLDYDARSTSDHRIAGGTKEISDIANQISMRMIFLTFLSIAVAFFAGSILADSLAHLDNGTRILITAVAAIIVGVIGYVIWSWKPDEKSKKGQ